MGDHRSGPPSRKDVRRRPTLPRSHPRSTIGAEGLSFRVRNGTGRFPFAMAAETLLIYQSIVPADLDTPSDGDTRSASLFPTVNRELQSGREQVL